MKSQLLLSEASYQRYVQKRRAFVASNHSQINPWPVSGTHIYYWDYFLPTFTCPHTLERIGTLGDGGKYVCGIELFNNIKSDKPCIVYSFGVAHESSYEAEILERTNCEIYGFDASADSMGPQVSPEERRAHFNKLFLGINDTSKDTKTLGSIMRQNGHSWIDFLKIDIEGAEFKVLNQIMDEFDVLPFGQLQIEIHGKGLFPQVFDLWERLEMKGLRAFKNEINFWPTVTKKDNPYLIEYAFLNLRGEHLLIA